MGVRQDFGIAAGVEHVHDPHRIHDFVGHS
jgi:hypothetical protein